MSVYKPRGSALYVYDFWVGGRRFHGPTGHDKKRPAEAVEREKRAEAAGQKTAIRDVTLDDAVGAHWAIAKDRPSARMVEYQAENLVKGFGGATLIRHIDDAMVADYVARARGRKYGKKIRKLISSAAVNRELALLRAILNRARRTRKATVQDIDWRAHWLREAPPRTRVLSDEEQRRLIDECADHLKPAVEFALMTGLRLGNTIGLEWSQVDFKARTMTFRAKGDRTLVLPITEPVLVILANQGPQDAGPVFRYKGEKITSWRTAWNGAKRRAGVKDFRWHDLRHTAASRMVAGGADISAVQEVLNHSSIMVTRRYVHHDQDAKRRALESLSQGIPKVSPLKASK
jgi:integrase